MATLDSIAPLVDFDAALAAGYVRMRLHDDPAVPYAVYDYSEKATVEAHWNPVTVASRGLIVNIETNEIVARPFGKFWNHQEVIPGWNDFAREGAVEVLDKADGSLGILYFLPDGSPAISTRGSMGSSQALHATEVYRAKYANFNARPDLTYLFEIVYPENRIVLGYGDLDDLILLGAVNKETGRSVSLEDARTGWSGPVVEKFEYASFLDVLRAPVPDDREGFVVRFVDSDRRVKIKGEEYLRLHRRVTNMTPRQVWAVMASGQDIDSWLATGIPEEFVTWVYDTRDAIQVNYDAEMNRLLALSDAITSQLPKDVTQKEFALAVQRIGGKDFGAMFLIRSGRMTDLSKLVWESIRPEHSPRLGAMPAK